MKKPPHEKRPPLTREQQELVLSVQNLAWKMARRFARQAEALGAAIECNVIEDYQAAAIHGACIAATKFEPERGLKFTTYAQFWMRNMITDQSRNDHQIGPCWREHRLARSRPTPKIERIDHIEEQYQARAREDTSPEKLEEAEIINNAFSKLDKKQQAIIKMRFINGDRVHKVAKTLEMSHMGVCRATQVALNKLRRAAAAAIA